LSILLSALARHYGQPVADLFERAWTSETLADCPTFGEWLVALPLTPSPQPPSPLPQVGEGKGVAAQPPGEEVRAAVDSTAEIRAFMQAARRLEEQNKLESALEVYRQALELAQADPSLRSLAREIELTVQDVEKRIAAQASRPQPAVETFAAPSISPLLAGEGEGVREQPRHKRPWGWVAAGLVVFALLAFLVYGVNLEQQQTVQTTAISLAQATDTAITQTTTTAQAQATQTPIVRTAAFARAQATQTAIARVTATVQAWAAARTSAPLQFERPPTYILHEGEFPYCLARRFDVDPDELFSINGLSTDWTGRVGMELKIPQNSQFPSEQRALRPHPTIYTVVVRDTIYSIACMFGDVYPEAIVLANNLHPPYTLTVGQEIFIP